MVGKSVSVVGGLVTSVLGGGVNSVEGNVVDSSSVLDGVDSTVEGFVLS